ncbi:MAG: phosphomannomutase/phosphoglucomutase, partial [Candidatus Wildermuthbacteria bacterium]|nr:phosphomannomutase/phosphoglucomutase [Candidatus Wildermuthbacteria bacterium]
MAAIKKSIFREYDIRGKEGTELTPETLELLGKGYGTFLRNRGIIKVVVGRDSRATSLEFSEAFLKGLCSTGCDVTNIKVVLVPLLYWAQYYLKSEGGVMITASHNPAGWNGLKLAVGYSQTLGQKDLEEIYDIVTNDRFIEEKGAGLHEDIDIFPPYIEDVLSKVHITKKFRILVNTGNGTAGLFTPELLRRAGCEVVEHLTALDPTFPHYTPNPAQVEMMEDTGKRVLEEHADFGFAYDADGDRLGLVDEKGQNVWPDRYLILLARNLLEEKPGAKIVFDVKVSQALPEDIVAHGGIPIMWKTGHSYIKTKMLEEKAELGGEMSGHIFFKEGYYGFDDALFASLKLLEYFSKREKPVSELIEETPRYISS